MIKEASKKIMGKILSCGKDNEPFTAENAWLQSRYGLNMQKPISDRILDKQGEIKEAIRHKFPLVSATDPYLSYHCLIDIEEDLINEVEEIFKPFKEGGFEIIDLSTQIKEIKENGVYLISWKHVFSANN